MVLLGQGRWWKGMLDFGLCKQFEWFWGVGDLDSNSYRSNLVILFFLKGSFQNLVSAKDFDSPKRILVMLMFSFPNHSIAL